MFSGAGAGAGSRKKIPGAGAALAFKTGRIRNPASDYCGCPHFVIFSIQKSPQNFFVFLRFSKNSIKKKHTNLSCFVIIEINFRRRGEW